MTIVPGGTRSLSAWASLANQSLQTASLTLRSCSRSSPKLLAVDPIRIAKIAAIPKSLRCICFLRSINSWLRVVHCQQDRCGGRRKDRVIERRLGAKRNGHGGSEQYQQ